MKKIVKKVPPILLNVFTVLFGVSMLFSSLCKNPEIDKVLCDVLGSGKTETIATGKEPIYYKTWYQNVEDLMAGSGEYAAASEAEGAVLLKNNVLASGKTALPLNKI